MANIFELDTFWHLVRSRKKLLTAEQLIDRPWSIMLRVIGWGAYSVVMVAILTEIFMGWISPVNGIVAVVVVVYMAFVTSGVMATYGVVAVFFAPASLFAPVISGLIAGSIAHFVLKLFFGAHVPWDLDVGVTFLAGACVSVMLILLFFFGAIGSRSEEFDESPLRSFRIISSRLILYFPIMPLIRLFDLWVAKNRKCWWIEKFPA
jgi:hypothetical protein